MSKKTVALKMPARATASQADDWVGQAGREIVTPKPERKAEPMKRLTIDMPAELHTRVKAGCAARGLKMADLLRELLDKEFVQKT